MDEQRGGRTGDLPLPGGNRIPAHEVEELASRSSGPGGQHVNTSSTRVTLRWNLRTTRGLRADDRARVEARLRSKLSREGVLIIHAGRHRSRVRNQALAWERLQELVAAALRTAPVRKPTRPSRAAKRRRLEEKRRVGARKNLRRSRPRLDD